jgi:hypothetical protein
MNEIAEDSADVARARVAATTVQTTPIDPARDIVGVKAGVHGTERSKGCQGLQAVFFPFSSDHLQSFRLPPVEVEAG